MNVKTCCHDINHIILDSIVKEIQVEMKHLVE